MKATKQDLSRAVDTAKTRYGLSKVEVANRLGVTYGALLHQTREGKSLDLYYHAVLGIIALESLGVINKNKGEK